MNVETKGDSLLLRQKTKDLIDFTSFAVYLFFKTRNYLRILDTFQQKKGMVKIPSVSYNNYEVIYITVARKYVKALVDHLSDEQVQALWIILNSMAWPEEEISPEEAVELEEARAEIKTEKGIKAEDVWHELGI